MAGGSPSTRAPNGRLRGLLAEAGWSGRQLAAAVNAAGREIRLDLHYDRTAVTHWLSGTKPRPPADELVVETLSRRLQRPLTLGSAGFGVAPPARASTAKDPPQHDATGAAAAQQLIEGATSVTRGRARRGGHSEHSLYNTADLLLPNWSQATADATSNRRGARRLVAVRGVDVAAAEDIVRAFHTIDATLGGGQANLALARYLTAHVAPLLQISTTPTLRRRLLTAATELAYLCAFMHFDDELHGIAQRYYRAALSLATENSDPTSYAITLRALSVQAHLLGHHRHALKLAEAAADSLPPRARPGVTAFVSGQLAVAHAARGDHRGAVAALLAAERQLERADPAERTATMGAYHHSALAHQQAAVHALLGQTRDAVTALEDSIRHRHPSQRRSLAITLARLGEVQLKDGQLDQATATWQRFLEMYPSIHSHRADTALITLKGQLRPYARTSAASAVLRNAAALDPRRP
jgi:tetratricopeptide (TPR) repeat protein